MRGWRENDVEPDSKEGWLDEIRRGGRERQKKMGGNKKKSGGGILDGRTKEGRERVGRA